MDPPTSLNLGAIFRGFKRENPVSLSTDKVAQLRHVILLFFFVLFPSDRLRRHVRLHVPHQSRMSAQI